jgi:hypothetical protein
MTIISVKTPVTFSTSCSDTFKIALKVEAVMRQAAGQLFHYKKISGDREFYFLA